MGGCKQLVMHRGNKETFRNALKVALEKANRYLVGRLAEFGEELLADAQFRKKYTSFTGNTLTSLAFGVYEEGSLTDIIFISGVKAPVHAKIRNGETVYLDDPYEGEPRTVKGEVDVQDAWGDETSISTLNALRPKRGNGIIITTGTEYSEFLEFKRGLNVLSDTEMYARMYGLSWMKSAMHPNMSI